MSLLSALSAAPCIGGGDSDGATYRTDVITSACVSRSLVALPARCSNEDDPARSPARSLGMSVVARGANGIM